MMSGEISISDAILKAKKRFQPYLNLVNSLYTTAEICSKENIGNYKKINLKSLYYRTGRLTLDATFVAYLNELTDAGIREVFIFCEDSGLDTKILNEFLQENHIRINLRVAPISESMVAKIKSDSVGQKDMLGFDRIESYKIVYRNGSEVNLLNNQASDEIILANHRAYKQKIFERYSFEVKEPKYIEDSEISGSRMNAVRNVKARKETLASQTELGVEQVLQLHQETEQSVSANQEQEEELSVDQGQLKHTLDERSAADYVDAWLHNSFHEAFLLGDIPRDPSRTGGNPIHWIFRSDDCIKHITQDAVDLMLPYLGSFLGGINLDNMPAGLAFDYKSGIIFASDKRLLSMPINDGTIRLDSSLPIVSDPLQYSWLPFAARSSISFDDIYNTPVAPTIRGSHRHPGTEPAHGDYQLDIPLNLVCYSEYSVDQDRQEPQFRNSAPHLPIVRVPEKLEGNIFPGVPFYNLTAADKERLQKIWYELKRRGITELFNKVLSNNEVNDGGYLLEEKTAVFLDKLFCDILPTSGEKVLPDKMHFFQQVFSYTYGSICTLEDVFVGLSYSYDKFQEFLFIEGITDKNRKMELNEKFREVMKELLKNSWSKVHVDHLISILRNDILNGGSLDEQLGFFEYNPALLTDFEAFKEAKLTGANVLHNFYLLNYDIAIGSPENGPPMIALEAAFKHLSSAPVHQRPSIDTYTRYRTMCYFEDESRDSCGYYGCHRSKVDLGLCILPSGPDMDGDYNYSRPEFETCEYVDSTVFKPGMRIKYVGTKAEIDMFLKNPALQGTFKRKGHAAGGIVTPDANLVNGFTTNQAFRNIDLLSLNIRSSVGKYYSRRYPDQEFSSYAALFGIILDKVKLKKEILVGTERLDIVENYNKGTAEIITKHSLYDPKLNLEVKQKEEAHERIVALFNKLYEENQEFNFSEVVSLGLVTHLCGEQIGKVTLQHAKGLVKYGDCFAQLLRVILATPSGVPTKNVEDELKNRALNIAHSLEFLNRSVSENQKFQEILTDKGKHPENLVLFATCLGCKGSIPDADVRKFLVVINGLSPNNKQQILDSLALTKLPFSQNTIIKNSEFPQFTIYSLEHPDSLKPIILKAVPQKISQAEVEKKTCFNDVSRAKLLNTKVDLSEVEREHTVTFSGFIKKCTFNTLKQNILQDKDFIKRNITGVKNRPDLSESDIKKIEYAVAVSMFAATSLHESGWELFDKKLLELSYDREQSIHGQFSRLIRSKELFDDLLQVCGHEQTKIDLFDLLLEQPHIPLDKLNNFLWYMKSVSDKIQKLNLTIPELLRLAPKQLYASNFQLFKVASDFLVNNPQFKVSAGECYQCVARLSEVVNSHVFIEKILKLCAERNNLSILSLVANIDKQSPNFKQIAEWITTLKIETAEDVVKNVDSKLLFGIKDFKKIPIVVEIVSKLTDTLTKEEYARIINHMQRCNMDEAILLKSYFLFPNIKYENGIDRQQIEFVLDHIDSLKDVQVMFSQNTERFSYDPESVEQKISQLRSKTPKHPEKPSTRQRVFGKSFATIMSNCQAFRDLNCNELRVLSLELKHERTLHKEADHSDLDLKFLALSFEVMYRNTGKFPRDTQILSVLNTMFREKHMIEEIATGEGKSITTALNAAYLWFTGQTVDVVTSSTDLSVRDSEEFFPFFDSLGIKHNSKTIVPNSETEVYAKGGVNYATASNLALFRANREFYSKKFDPALNTNVSLICDEADAALTGEVNFKLTVPLIDLTQEETKVLFAYILGFSGMDVFKNVHVSRADDVKNLQLFLNYQFEKHNSSMHFPLTALQLEELTGSRDPIAKELYILNQALVKSGTNQEKLLDKLLDSVEIAKSLQEGVNFVLPKDKSSQEQPLKAIPIVKDQPSEGTIYGNGVQAFLHLLLEKKYPELKGRFDVLPPTATIFNLTPKNFFDYYRLANGRIIGLTGTAGDEIELREFKETQGIKALSIPLFKQSQREVLEPIEVSDSSQQNESLKAYLKKQALVSDDRPVLIFCESTKHAEEVFKYIKANDLAVGKTLQMHALSTEDTADVKHTLENAGKPKTITIVTKMLGRGTDFDTKHEGGFCGINLCTDVTRNGLLQIYGRIARKGVKGTVMSIFNRAYYERGATSYVDHMRKISEREKSTRERLRPLGDVLKYFSLVNRDNPTGAILANVCITEIWNDLLEENSRYMPQKTVAQLRDEFVGKVCSAYPGTSEHLPAYLKRLDSKETKLPGTEAVYTAVFAKQNISPVLRRQAVLTGENATLLAREVPISEVEKPLTVGSTAPFQNYIQAHNIIMLTHALTLGKKNYRLKSSLIQAQYLDETNFYTGVFPRCDKPVQQIFFNFKDEKLWARVNQGVPFEITREADGIPPSLFDKIKACKKDNESTLLKLEPKEEVWLQEYLPKKENIVLAEYTISGEGSQETLMLSEFKDSFSSYKERLKIYGQPSVEVDKIEKLVDNYISIKDLDLSKLESGKYQAISIDTKVTSEARHGEAILTDGKFLFWINRGSESGEYPGIKVFKIAKDIKEVRKVLEDLIRQPKSQFETRKLIDSLLERDSAGNPKFVPIKMALQKIGSCGWVRAKTMLKALGIVGHIGNLGDKLPDAENQQWQQAIKNGDDIYKDFTTFDRMTRVEAVLYSLNPKFEPKFLDTRHKSEIDDRRKFVTEPISDELLQEITKKWIETERRYSGTIYEGQYKEVLKELKIEVILNSKIGSVLQQGLGKSREDTRKYLKDYFLSGYDEIYNIVKEGNENKISSLATELFKQLPNMQFIRKISDELLHIGNTQKFPENIEDIKKLAERLQQLSLALEEKRLDIQKSSGIAGIISQEILGQIGDNAYDLLKLREKLAKKTLIIGIENGLFEQKIPATGSKQNLKNRDRLFGHIVGASKMVDSLPFKEFFFTKDNGRIEVSGKVMQYVKDVHALVNSMEEITQLAAKLSEEAQQQSAEKISELKRSLDSSGYNLKEWQDQLKIPLKLDTDKQELEANYIAVLEQFNKIARYSGKEDPIMHEINKQLQQAKEQAGYVMSQFQELPNTLKKLGDVEKQLSGLKTSIDAYKKTWSYLGKKILGYVTTVLRLFSNKVYDYAADNKKLDIKPNSFMKSLEEIKKAKINLEQLSATGTTLDGIQSAILDTNKLISRTRS